MTQVSSCAHTLAKASSSFASIKGIADSLGTFSTDLPVECRTELAPATGFCGGKPVPCTFAVLDGAGSRLCPAQMHLAWVSEWKRGGHSVDVVRWRGASWSLEFPWSFAKERSCLLQAGTGTFLHCHDLTYVPWEQPVHNQKLACVWWSMLFFCKNFIFHTHSHRSLCPQGGQHSNPLSLLNMSF